MKQLYLNVNFKLPEDFSGDLNDAIEELLKYRRKDKPNEDEYSPDCTLSNYENWWRKVTTTNGRLFGEVSLVELKGNKWEDIE